MATQVDPVGSVGELILIPFAIESRAKFKIGIIDRAKRFGGSLERFTCEGDQFLLFVTKGVLFDPECFFEVKVVVF